MVQEKRGFKSRKIHPKFQRLREGSIKENYKEFWEKSKVDYKDSKRRNLAVENFVDNRCV